MRWEMMPGSRGPKYGSAPARNDLPVTESDWRCFARPARERRLVGAEILTARSREPGSAASLCADLQGETVLDFHPFCAQSRFVDAVGNILRQ